MYRGKGQPTINSPEAVEIRGAQWFMVGLLTGGFRAWMQSIEVVKNSGIGKRYLNSTWFFLIVALHFLMATVGFAWIQLMPVMWFISVITLGALFLRMDWLRKIVHRPPMPRTIFYYHGSPRPFWFKLKWFQPYDENDPEYFIKTHTRNLLIQSFAEPPLLIFLGFVLSIVDPFAAVYLAGGGLILFIASLTRLRDWKEELEDREIDQLGMVEEQILTNEVENRMRGNMGYGNQAQDFVVGADDE